MVLTQNRWSVRVLIFFIGVSVNLSLVSTQAAQQNSNVSVSSKLGDDFTVAALAVAVVACVGVVCLAVIIACLMSRLRRERGGMSVSNDIAMVEKAPLPHQNDVRQHGIDQVHKVQRQGSVSVGVGTLRQVTLSLLQDLLLNLYNVSVKKADHNPQRKKSVARKESEQQIVTTTVSDEVQKQLRNGLIKIFPRDTAKVETFLALGQSIMTATTVRQLSDSAFRAMRVCMGVVREWGVASEDYVGVVPTEGQGHVSVAVEDEVNSLLLTWDADKFCSELLTTVSTVCQALRDERRQPTPDEYLAFQLAYHLLDKGQQMTNTKHRPLGSPGFRPHVQTQLALTDSGYGHVLGTTRRSDWLQGVVVHVQHVGSLEGDSDLAPSLFDFGKVRLHVGDAAPTTFFVSRRLGHKGEKLTSEVWEAELSRMVQLTANSISAAFYQGAAACHVSMAGLTTSQAAAFMSQLRPHVHRERHLQTLSAVWDLGTPLTDDYEAEEGVGPEATPTARRTKVIEEPHHIARRAIEITLVGGFDQVTWYSSCDENASTASENPDGITRESSQAQASQSDKSTCVLRSLAASQILSLVHLAHSRGLLTYFTGGVTCADIHPAVLGGVDGVGVGGVGMLHHANTGRNTKERHGPFMEENIPQVLACRDESAITMKGRGAHLLARLDTMFFEGSLASAENAMRSQLFNAIVDEDEGIIKSILTKFQDVMQLRSEFGHPIMGTANRLVSRKTPGLKDVAESAYEWAMFITRLRTLVGRGDESGVCEEYGGEPWHTYRRKYRERPQGPRGYFRQVSFQVALKTDFSFE
ncbi:uncharacterized protein [Littorina saxatilis]|uniref:Uncharacterized protein n=1 Tax=Littorina saxatilis TaxID=31220 RepID=A0AAN9BFF1_9CAEN